MTPALAFSGVSVWIGDRTVLQGIDLSVASGEVLGVVGANGGGKTTLLRAGVGLMAASKGAVELAGSPLSALSDARRAARVGYLPQERRIGWNLPAWRVVALGRPDQPPARSRPDAVGVLAEVGLADLAERGVLDMSGGERARVLLARLLLTGAPLLVADEPAAGLDPDAQLQVMERLIGRARAGAAILVSLHDLTLAARCCDRLALLSAGRLIALGPPEEVLTPTLLETAFNLEGALAATPHGPVVSVRRKA
jgi:iron complex transport system ATP-binding protein